jgi:hypothetical protein
VTNRVDIYCHQSWKPKVPQDERHICDQSHHNNQPLYQRLALMGKKSSSDVTFPVHLISERAEDLRHKPCTTANLRCLVMQGQMPNTTPNTRINVIRPLNASKHQCHLTIMMTVIATKIVTCQHTHKTTVPLQLNRLQIDAVGAEAKLLLASKMIDSSNNFHFYLHICQKVTACATVPTNASDATWTTIIVNAFLS